MLKKELKLNLIMKWFKENKIFIAASFIAVTLFTFRLYGGY